MQKETSHNRQVLRWFPVGINRNVTLLWLGGFISAAGDRIYEIALMWYVLQITGSAFQTGLVPAVALLAQLIVGLFAGVMVDHWPKKPIMVSADIVRAVLVGGAAVWVAHDHLPLWYIYSTAFALKTAGLFFTTATGVVLPELVPRVQLLQTNAFLELTQRLTALTSRSLGGGIVAVLGTAGAMAGNAFSFGISACCIALVRLPRTVQPPPMPRQSGTMLTALSEGFAFIRQHLLLRPLISLAVGANVGGGLVVGLTPVLVQQQLGGDVTILGLLSGALVFGGLLGTTMVTRWGHRLPLGTSLIGSFVVYGGVLLLLSGVGWWPVALLLFAIQGWALALNTAPLETLLQVQTPPALRGRVFTTFGVLVNLGSPLAIMLGAWGAETIGLSWMYLCAGGLVLSCGIWGWLHTGLRRTTA